MPANPFGVIDTYPALPGSLLRIGSATVCIRLDRRELRLAEPPAGASYCEPAAANSSGASPTISAAGSPSERVAIEATAELASVGRAVLALQSALTVPFNDPKLLGLLTSALAREVNSPIWRAGDSIGVELDGATPPRHRASHSGDPGRAVFGDSPPRQDCRRENPFVRDPGKKVHPGPRLGASEPDSTLTDALLRESGWVRALALRLARDQASADDAAQSTIALALERRPEVDSSLRPWLARVVTRLTRRRVREEARRSSRERVAAERASRTESNGELLERFELQRALADRVHALPEPYRGVVLRRYFGGQSASEIARETGASAATVRSQIARGVERLRRDFAQDHDRSGGALALFLSAAGPRGELLSLRGAEIMAMKTTAKFGLVTLVVAATLLTTRGLLQSTPGIGRSAEDDAVLIRSDAVGDPVDELVEVDEAPSRESAIERVRREGEATVATAIAPETAAEVSTIRARIVDESDAPLEGAELRSVFMDGRPRGEDCYARSNADGEVVVEIEDRFMRAYETEVFAMGFRAGAPMRETIFVVSRPRWRGVTELGDIVLRSGGAAEGLIVDESGRPLSGAVVFAADPVLVEGVERLRLTGPSTDQRRPRAESDTTGRFSFPGIRAGTHRLFAGAEGRLWSVSEPIDVAAGSTRDVGTLILEPIPAEELIRGLVRRPDGSPAAGAAVAYEMRMTRREGTLETNAEGRFSFNPAGPGDVEFIAKDPEDRFGMSALAVASRGDSGLVLELVPRREIVMTIVDGDGEPLPGASVTTYFTDRDLFADGGRPIPGEDWTPADGAGIARIGVPQQEFTIGASLRDYAGERCGPFLPAEAPAELRVVLVRDPVIRGRVLASGEPVEGAMVEVARRIEGFVPLESGFPMRFFMGSIARVETDAEGRFEFAVDPEWTDVSILAFHDDLATGETEATLEAGVGVDGIVVQMTDGGSIRGTLIAPAGMDADELYVAASRGDGHPVWTRPSADGTYRFDRLTPGPWRVEGRLREPLAEVMSVANDREDKEFRWNAEVVDGREAIHDVDMRGRGHVALHGRLFIDGEPASGWSVTAEREADSHTGRGIPSTEIDGGGDFVLDVPAGTCTLTIAGRLEGGTRARVVRELELEGTRIDWEALLRTGVVDVSIEDSEGQTRICRGASHGPSYELTFLEADADGRIAGRAFTGEGHVQALIQLSIGPYWSNLRALDVRAD